MKTNKIEPSTVKTPNKGNKRGSFEWQGKRRGQVEFSYKAAMIPMLIFGAWLFYYFLFQVIKWLINF